MSIGAFLSDQVGVGRTMSAGPTTGFGEAVGAGITQEWTQPRNFGGAMQYIGNPLNQRNELLKARTGRDIYDLTDVRKKYTKPAGDGFLRMQEEANGLVDDVISRGRQENPELYDGIKTTAEIKEAARVNMNMNERHFNEIMIRNPSAVSRTMGGFIGSFTGAMIDPPNLLTLPLGSGPVKAGLKGWAAARGIMKAAAIDGTINATIEAGQQPLAMKWSEDMGRRYGLGDAAESVGLSFAGGAAFSGLIRGAAHGLKRPLDYMGSVSADVLDRVASNEKLPASVRDAAAFMSRQAHIDESAPPDAIKTSEDLKLHRDRAQAVSEDFENYRPSALSSDGDSLDPLNMTSATEAPRDQALPSQTSEVAPPSAFDRSRAITPPSSRTGDVSISAIDTSTNKLYHRVDNPATIKKLATKLAPELKSFLDNTVQGVDGASVYGVRVKEPDSLGLKLGRGKGAQQVSDYVGGRIVAESPQAMREIIQRLSDRGDAIEVDNFLGGQKTSGYRAVHVQVMSDKGVSAEIQVQPREIRDVQDEAHIIYKKWQNIGDDATPEEVAAMVLDRARAKKMFDDAWSQWEARTGADSFDDMKPAERLASSDIPLPEGLSPDVSADRIAIAERDLKELVDELGDEMIALDDGRTVSMKEFAEEVQGKKAIIEAMKTCRLE